MVVKFFNENKISRQLSKNIEVCGGDWLFHFTGRDERMPGLKILFFDSIKYDNEKINDIDDDIWGIKISFKREYWEHFYKNTGKFKMILELMFYNKDNGFRKGYEMFRMPTLLKSQKIYKIHSSDILNENIYNLMVKIINFEDTVNMCIRFKVKNY